MIIVAAAGQMNFDSVPVGDNREGKPSLNTFVTRAKQRSWQLINFYNNHEGTYETDTKERSFGKLLLAQIIVIPVGSQQG